MSRGFPLWIKPSSFKKLDHDELPHYHEGRLFTSNGETYAFCHSWDGTTNSKDLYFTDAELAVHLGIDLASYGWSQIELYLDLDNCKIINYRIDQQIYAPKEPKVVTDPKEYMSLQHFGKY